MAGNLNALPSKEAVLEYTLIAFDRPYSQIFFLSFLIRFISHHENRDYQSLVMQRLFMQQLVLECHHWRRI